MGVLCARKKVQSERQTRIPVDMLNQLKSLQLKAKLLVELKLCSLCLTIDCGRKRTRQILMSTFCGESQVDLLNLIEMKAMLKFNINT